MRMTFPLLRFALPVLCVAVSAIAADAPPSADPKPSVKEEMKTLVIEDAKKQAAAPTSTAAPAAQTPAAPAPAPSPLAPATPPLSSATPPPAPAPKPATATPPAPEPATALPKVEVRSSRITEMDLKIRQQEKDIAREQEKTKPTEMDKALNGSKVSKALSIFGGQSADSRADFAKERVSMMEDEKDVMEAIKQAKTKEEKAELQKQLNELQDARRDLEQAARGAK